MFPEHPLLIVVTTLLIVLAVYLLVLFVAAKGDIRRIRLALRCELRVLRDAAFAAKVEALLAPSKPEAPPKPSGAPLRLLALLQREGRLLDFLLEDIQSYPDAQIGAAVRDIHRQCQAAIKEHLVLQPVLPQAERAEVDVPRGFDPAQIRLVGNVTGEPPFK